MHDTNMKPITTEASYRQTNKWTDRHNSSVALVNGRTLKKNFPSASFFLASSNYIFIKKMFQRTFIPQHLIQVLNAKYD